MHIPTSVYCTSLRLPSKKRGNDMHIPTSFYCVSLLVRRKILRLYFG